MVWEEREVQVGGDICIIMADSCYCKAETNTTLETLKNNFFKNKKNEINLNMHLDGDMEKNYSG